MKLSLYGQATLLLAYGVTAVQIGASSFSDSAIEESLHSHVDDLTLMQSYRDKLATDGLPEAPIELSQEAMLSQKSSEDERLKKMEKKLRAEVAKGSKKKSKHSSDTLDKIHSHSKSLKKVLDMGDSDSDESDSDDSDSPKKGKSKCSKKQMKKLSKKYSSQIDSL